MQSESWAEANAQTKIDNQSIEVAPGPKQIAPCPQFLYPDSVEKVALETENVKHMKCPVSWL